MAIGNSALEVITAVELPGEKQLPLIVDAPAAIGLAPGLGKAGKQQRREDRDDRNCDEKLDQAKSLARVNPPRVLKHVGSRTFPQFSSRGAMLNCLSNSPSRQCESNGSIAERMQLQCAFASHCNHAL